MANIFEEIHAERSKGGQAEEAPSGNIFEQIHRERSQKAPEPQEQNSSEPLHTQIARTAYAPVGGALRITPYGIATSLGSALGKAEALQSLEELDPERIAELKEKFPTAPWKEGFNEVNRESFMKALEQAESFVPTIDNIEKFLEKNTGLPLEAKTGVQKFLQTAGAAGKINPGTAAEKIHTGLKAMAYKSALEAGGVNEDVSDVVSTVLAQGKFQLPKQSEGKAATKAPESKTTPPGEPPPPEVPPSEPPAAKAPELPKEGEIKAPPQFFKSDFEIAESIKGALSPLQIEVGGTQATPRSAQKALEPVAPVLNEISPRRITDANQLGRMTRSVTNQVLDEQYKETGKLWNKAREVGAKTKNVRPELENSLVEIIRESQGPVKGGEAKTKSFAEDLRDLIAPKRPHPTKSGATKRVPRPVSNEQLIDSIINARKGYDYRYQGGVEGHRINQFINAVEDELLRSSSPAERKALLSAREATKNWAQVAKNPQVLPFRQQNVDKPNMLYKSSLNPDTFAVLDPILKQNHKGEVLSQLLKRNIVEQALEPFLLNPASYSPLKFERAMGKLTGILSPQQVQALENRMASFHAKSLEAPAKPTEIPFLNQSEKQIASKLKTVEGLRELKGELNRVGKHDLYEEIAKTQGLDLLFGGKTSLDARSNRITEMLGDRNGRFYLRETLGEKNVEALEELSKANQLEKRLAELENSKEMSQILKDPVVAEKGAKTLYYALTGKPVSAVMQSYQLYKKIRSKRKGFQAPRENIEIS